MSTGTDEYENHDGFLCRPGSADRIAVEDTRRVFRRPGAPELGDVVLDLGSHIGSFTKRALDAGATAVRAVEPDPGNNEMFRLNVHDPRAELIEAAVAPKHGTATLYLGRTHGHSTQSAVGLGRPTIKVPAFTLEELCATLNPTYVKIDVEGAEYDIGLPESLPSSVDRVFLEFHLTYGQRPKAEALRKQMADAGWSPLWETNWKRGYVEGVFTR